MASLGELLSKTANEVYLDLKSMLTAMKTQDAELRTSVMKLFILHSRKKLAQCYSLIRWLSVKGVTQKLHSITDLDSQLSEIENGANQQLDELFFSHASIYSMRCAPYSLTAAANVLSSGSFDGLPLSIFTCGLPVLPSVQDETNITEQLDIFIAAKLALNDHLLPLYKARADILGGVLCVTVPGYFQVHLSLLQLNVAAQWTALGCRLLVQEAGSARAGSRSSNDPDFAPLEENLTGIANEHLAAAAAATGEASDALARALLVCRHGALAASLRMMHGQAVEAAAGRWSGLIQVQLDERARPGVSQLRVLLWLNPLTREYALGLGVSHNRKAGSPPDADHSAGLTDAGALSCELTVRNAPEAGSARSLEPGASADGRQVRGFGALVPAEEYVRGGVRFYALLDEALRRCAALKAEYLAERLRGTLGTLGDIGTRYTVQRSGGYLLLSRTAQQSPPGGGGPVGVTVEVDVRGGKFVLSSARAALGQAVLAGWQRDLDLFAAEINNVESEQLFGRFLLGDALQPARGVPITTVEALLRALDLSHWDRIASAALTAPGVRLDLRSSETGSALGIESRSIAYCIAEWESAATVSRRHLRTFRELFKHGHKTGGAAHVAARTGKRTFGQFSGSAGTSSGGGDQQRSAVSVHLELSVVPGSSSLAARAVLSLPARDGDRSGVVQPQAIDVSGGFGALRDVADAKAVSQWLAACAERAIDNAISALVAPVRGAVGDAEHGPIIRNPSCVTTVEEDAGAVAVSLLRNADLGEAKLAGTAYCQMRVLRFPPGDSQRKCGGCQWLVEDLRLSVAEHAQQDHELRRAYEVFLREVVQRSLAGRRPLVDSQGGLDSLRRVLAVLQPLLHLLAYCATIAGSSEPAAGFLRPVDFVRGGEEGSGDLIVLLAAHSRGAQSEGDGGMSCNRSLAHGYVEVTCRPVEAQQGGSELFIRDVAAAESQEEEGCVEPAEVKLLRVLKGICARNSDTIG